MNTLSRELRQVIRLLGRSPAFSFVSIVILALAIGTTTPTFSIIEAYLLRPLPFSQPDRLVHLWSTNQRQGADQQRVALSDFLDWKQESRSFSDLAAFNYTGEDLTALDPPEQISAGRATANLFDTPSAVSPSSAGGSCRERIGPGPNRSWS